MNRYLLAIVLAAFPSPVMAQQQASKPVCYMRQVVVIPCPGETPPPGGGTPPPITPTGITLSTTGGQFPEHGNADDLVATIIVTATGGTYAGTLTLGGADAAKFALTNGGVYPGSALKIGPNDITGGTYHISITAP